ncbi:hypothetical protein GCM10029963_63030 [Micromonospora andamanensis]
MNRQAQAVILLLLGGAVIRASVTDLYLRYVKEGLRPFLIAAGLLLIAAAIMTLWYELRPAAPAPWLRSVAPTPATTGTGTPTTSLGSGGCSSCRCSACCWSPRRPSARTRRARPAPR